MEAPNAGLLFNKTLFKRLDNKAHHSDDTKRIHQILFRLDIHNQKTKLLTIKESIGEGPSSRKLIDFPLKTTWPGLMMGLGYGHGTKGSDDEKDANKGEFKTGFYFDFTTGLPVIPGSTIKGILRSFFPGRYKDVEKGRKISERLIEILNDLGIKPDDTGTSSWDEKKVKQLEEIVFDGKKDGKKISPLKQDIFFEAVPLDAGESNVLTGNYSERKTGVFLGEDTIAPHRHPLKNPVPLKLLKILPGVTIQFQFLFNNEGIKNSEKKILFKELLVRFGVGAKTTSGFGKFKNDNYATMSPDEDWFIPFDELPKKRWEITEENDSESDADPIYIAEEREADNNITVYESPDWIDASQIKRRDMIKGTVIRSGEGNLYVQLHIKDFKIFQNVNGTEAVNSEIWLQVQDTEGSIKKGNFSVKVVRKK